MTKGFEIHFDKNTIDHLGIKLYSSFPPVIAEMVSNAYDADAENVIVEIDYQNKAVCIIDDGNGMNHDEINNSFLVIGRNRRVAENTGLSKKKKRKVTGKKGLGKLAVFGIAETIEVISIQEGVKNSFRINYKDLKATQKNFYKPEVIEEYVKTDQSSGTMIVIKDIKQKNITEMSALATSLSNRFSFYDDDFSVQIEDAKDNTKRIRVTKSLYFDSMQKEFKWRFPDDFEDEIKNEKEIKFLHDNGVTGEIFTKPTPLRSNETGFLLYARKKLASEHIFFNERSNDRFHSYVTGYFHIDFIDESNGDDMIATARQSILWDENENIKQLKISLDKLVKKIGVQWKAKRKESKDKKVIQILPDDFYDELTPAEKSSLLKIKSTLISNSSDIEDMGPMVKVLETVKSMYKFESFQQYIIELDEEDLTLETINKIANDWEAIESKELAKVAVGRIQAINQFEKFINEDASESKVIQPFLEKFPWILDPRITTFEREKTFKKILLENFPDDDLEEKNKRIDFLCNAVNGELIIIELKRPSIKISIKEILQARSYEMFINRKHKSSFGKKVTTYLISDRYDMDDEAKDIAESHEASGKLFIRSYSELLNQAKQYNQEFIDKYDEVVSIKENNHNLSS